MRTKTTTRKTEAEVVGEKLRVMNNYLKNADLSPVYEVLERNKAK